jgi:hypothetical protein
MALTSLLNLVAPIAEPTARASQNAETQAPAQSQTPLAQPVGNTANAGGRQDEFVFSNPNDQAFGQGAGLFTVKQPAVFAPAADLLLTPAGPPIANANAGNFPSTTANAVGEELPGVPVAVGANVPATVGVSIVAAGVILAAINPTGPNAGATGITALPGGAAATAGAAVGSPSVEAQLQALNVALEALGLNPAEISKVDQIASLINDFSPTAYTSLVYQLVLAGTAAPPTPNANAEANTANATAPPAAAAKAATA